MTETTIRQKTNRFIPLVYPEPEEPQSEDNYQDYKLPEPTNLVRTMKELSKHYYTRDALTSS